MLLDERAINTAEEYRRRKVTSVLTIMFTDIAGSTELREELGEVSYEHHREGHDEAVRGLVESANAGCIVKSTGDGALAIFAEPSEAVRKALDVQAELATDRHFKLRIGIDMGQVTVISRGTGIVADVFGRQVNRAARIQALAQPGHVLTSFHVYDCAVGWLTGTALRWHNHGKAALKGFAEGISIHEPYYPQHILPQVTPSEIIEAARQEAVRQATAIQEALISDTSTNDPIIHAPQVWSINSVEPTDPIQFYVQAISKAVAELSKHKARIPAVLWVDDNPENNNREREILNATGCTVDLAVSTLDAIQKLSSSRYALVISDMKRGSSPVAGLDLLDWMNGQKGMRFLTLLYCSSHAVSLYEAEAKKRGALLCTAGMVSLLDGIFQVIHYLNWECLNKWSLNSSKIPD
jgi:class 3 adenylate cyclase/CheY-like chemotaxis protein